MAATHSASEGEESTAPVSPNDWDRLIEAAGPAVFLMRIEGRMSSALKGRMSAEDLWQDTLLHAWRDRERLEWHGLRAFRRWLLSIAENRIRDAVDRDQARKRAAIEVPLSSLETSADSSATPPDWHCPLTSSTPSRVALHSELAQRMRDALGALPEELREVVRLRVFEELEIAEIANRLGLGASAVKHRLRRGSELYTARLGIGRLG